MKTIAIITGNNLSNNPRVVKEATTLAKLGYEVVVLGAWTDSKQRQNDTELLKSLPFAFQATLDLSQDRPVSSITRLFLRARGKLGHLIFKLAKIENSWQFGWAISHLHRSAWNTTADLYIAHSEAGMLVAVRLMKKGRKVALDLEDWFSEDLVPKARINRPTKMLAQLESILTNKASYCSCTSEAISSALVKRYNCPRPTVIYNAFPWGDRGKLDQAVRDRASQNRLSIYWFSQSVGHGRGLEDLLGALPLVTSDLEIHLRGKPEPNFDNWFEKHVPPEWKELVFIHEPVSPMSLLSRISEHDIGFAGEMTYATNKDLTVSNKILHYLLGGIPVLASATTGQLEIAGTVKSSVASYPSGNIHELAKLIDLWAHDRDLLNQAKSDALDAARTKYCWERQESSLSRLVEHAIN